jgi:hypothetical protein
MFAGGLALGQRVSPRLRVAPPGLPNSIASRSTEAGSVDDGSQDGSLLDQNWVSRASPPWTISAQITNTSRVITIMLHTGWKFSDASWAIALIMTTITANTRAHVAPENRPNPASSASRPIIRWIQPHPVTSRMTPPPSVAMKTSSVKTAREPLDDIERAEHDQREPGKPNPTDPSGDPGPIQRTHRSSPSSGPAFRVAISHCLPGEVGASLSLGEVSAQPAPVPTSVDMFAWEPQADSVGGSSGGGPRFDASKRPTVVDKKGSSHRPARPDLRRGRRRGRDHCCGGHRTREPPAHIRNRSRRPDQHAKPLCCDLGSS